MSRLKSVPAVGWVVVGIAIAVLAVPMAAGAKAALRYTGIEGTSGSQADVSPAGQLATAPAAPSAFVQSTSQPFTVSSCPDGCASAWEPVTSAPTGSALVVSVLHVVPDGEILDLQPFTFEIQSSATCVGTQVGTFSQLVNPIAGSRAPQEVDVSEDPGLVLPEGDTLCASTSYPDGDNGQTTLAWTSVSGYTIPAAAG